MYFIKSLFVVGCLASPAVLAATIVQTLGQRAELSSVAAFIATTPAWSGPSLNKTLIAPTNTAVSTARASGILPATASGAFFLPDTAVDHRTRPNYKILKGPDGAMLFDNYVPDGPPEIHIRSSSANGLATGQIQCDDGWLYISNIVIEPALKPTIAASQGPPQATSFINLFAQLGLAGVLDALTGVTIMAPSNAAIAAAQAQLATLAPNQVAAVLAAHIGQFTRFSTELDPTAIWPTLNSDVNFNLTYADESATVNGVRMGFPVDTPTSAGVIHILNGVIIPAKLPVANASPVALGTFTVSGTLPATPTSTTAPPTTTPGGADATTTTRDPGSSKTTTTATATPTDNATSGGVSKAVSYVGALIAGAVGLIVAA
ncbi:hypothetical protein DFS34DRAFT_623626 [Phlyctochytrium arcticum]|nr:hypothetical protein DFS34DRAFT_623626 [Phlyctochytrium arcticum]